MARTRSELESILDELESELPALLEDTEDQDDFWMAFTALADSIEDSAGPNDLEYVRERINSMLGSSGLLTPGDGSAA